MNLHFTRDGLDCLLRTPSGIVEAEAQRVERQRGAVGAIRMPCRGQQRRGVGFVGQCQGPDAVEDRLRAVLRKNTAYCFQVLASQQPRRLLAQECLQLEHQPQPYTPDTPRGIQRLLPQVVIQTTALRQQHSANLDAGQGGESVGVLRRAEEGVRQVEGEVR